MLRKLIKYDMRYIARIVPWVYLAALGMSLLMCLLIFLTSIKDVFGIVLGVTAIPFILVLSAISISGFIMIAIRIYKNLYSDEGYLTFTLPATVDQQILSKVFSGALWEFIGMVVALITLALPLVTAYCSFSNKIGPLDLLIDRIGYFIRTFLGDGYGDITGKLAVLLVLFAVYLVIAIFANPITLLLSFSIGQFTKKNRVLAAIGSYFGITFALSFITTILQLIFEVVFAVDFANAGATDTAYVVYMLNSYISMFIMQIVIFAVFYIVSYFTVKKIMRDKLNLV